MSAELLLVLLCCILGCYGCYGFFSSTALNSPLPVSHLCGGRKLPGSSVSLLSAKKYYDTPHDLDGLMALQNYPPPEFSRPFSLRQLGSNSR